MNPVIGLEIHIQLKTESKLFCGCSTASFGAPPNTNICPICTGNPGVLPVLNKGAVEQIMTAGIATQCNVNPISRFARKNYFYPDLPKAYQISQYEEPICSNGEVEYYTGGEKKKCRIGRIHMEEDAGKLLHAIGSEVLNHSLVDYNRSGSALAETVTQPDLKSSQEASDFLVALRNIMRSTHVSNCDLEKGEMRVDVNVSLTHPDGSLGTRVEIKNLNSFKAVRDAIEHEIARQAEVLKEGGKITQETRLWDVKNNQTISMRSKEESSDYRYFPEPDLLPLVVTPELLDAVRKACPPLPHQKIEAYQEKYGLSLNEAQAILFNEDSGIPALFDEATKKLINGSATPRVAANWILNDLLGTLKATGKSVEEAGMTSERFIDFVKTISEKNLPSKISKEIFSKLLSDPKATATAIAKEGGANVIADEGELLKIITQVIKEKEKVVQDYKGGKESALQSLVGGVMKATKGKAHPAKTKELLEKELKK